MNIKTQAQKSPTIGRVYTDEDRLADAAYAALGSDPDKVKRSQQLGLLGSLAEAGSAVARYYFGEILYGEGTVENRRRGLRSHMLAAESGYVRSLVAIQKHEDPFLRKFDLLRDPTPMGCDRSIVSIVHNHRYPRIALLVEGLEQGVLGLGLDIAEELLDEVNFAPATRVGQQQSHLLALAYGLIRSVYDGARTFDGPGSTAAIEENRAIAAGFGSLGDRKARERIAKSETLTFFTRETAAQLRAYEDPRSSPIPHARGLDHSDPVDFGADALIGLVCELGRLNVLYRGSGINLLSGLLWFLSCVELGCGWNQGGAIGAELSRGYRELGGTEGLHSYLTRVFSAAASIRYTGSPASDKPMHLSTGLGEHLASNNTREVLILDRETSRFQKRDESWGSSQIYIPNTTNVQSNYVQAVVTEGHFFIGVSARKACLSLYAENKFKTQKVTRKDVKREEQVQRWRSYSSTDIARCTTTEEVTEPVIDFQTHEFFPLDQLRDGERLKSLASRLTHTGGGKAQEGASWDVDRAVESARLQQLSASARGQSTHAAASALATESLKHASLSGNLESFGSLFKPGNLLVSIKENELRKQNADDRKWRRLRADQMYRRRLPVDQTPGVSQPSDPKNRTG